MPELILGPLLRFVSEDEAVFWVETGRAMRGRGARRARAHLLRLRSSLRHRLRERTGALHLARIRGAAGRRAGVARPRGRAPAQRLQDLSEGAPATAAVRLMPGRGAAHTALLAAQGRGRAWPRDRRAPHACRAHAEGGSRALARRAHDARRPGVRRRGLAGDDVVPRGAPRHGRAPGPARARLRGIHGALQGELVRPGDPLAAVDGLVGDDLRRPRRPRRLEHLRELARGDARDRLVGRALHRRADVVLGLPAPRQPDS